MIMRTTRVGLAFFVNKKMVETEKVKKKDFDCNRIIEVEISTVN